MFGTIKNINRTNQTSANLFFQWEEQLEKDNQSGELHIYKCLCLGFAKTLNMVILSALSNQLGRGKPWLWKCKKEADKLGSHSHLGIYDPSVKPDLRTKTTRAPGWDWRQHMSPEAFFIVLEQQWVPWRVQFNLWQSSFVPPDCFLLFWTLYVIIIIWPITQIILLLQTWFSIAHQKNYL